MQGQLVASTSGKSAPQSGSGASSGSWTERMVAAEDWERTHEAEWVRVDQKLRGIAARRASLDAEEVRLLRYAEELKLWRGYGFGSLIEYMERVMGYAPHTATERLRVARALAELPLLEEALEQGQLAHSAVRELSRVAVPETEAVWLEAVQGKCLREVEAMVSGRRPGNLPDDPTERRLHRKTITLELSPETYDIWRKLHALAAEEHGQRLSDDELIQTLFHRAYRTGRLDEASMSGAANTGIAVPNAADTPVTVSEAESTEWPGAGTSNTALVASAAASTETAASAVSSSAPAGAASTDTAPMSTSDTDAAPSGTASTGPTTASIASATASLSSPAYKIALKQCPDCSRAWQYSGGRDIEVDPAVLECAECDAVYLGSLDSPVPQRVTATVTPRKREQVLARDGHCCTVPGCRRNVGLDLHHIEYQSRGGRHELSNLTTICDLHHRAVHFEKLVIRGLAPSGLTFEFRKPRDRRNVIDDDAPLRSTDALPTGPRASATSPLSVGPVASAGPATSRPAALCATSPT